MGLLSAIGGLVGLGANLFGASKERKMQKEFAQKGIQWKVADATKAGLHPLAALGANTMSYSPVQIGDMAQPLSEMGQNVDRSITATRNGSERANAQVAALQLERAGLENDLLRSQIASTNAQLRAQVGPSMPTDGGVGAVIDGQGNSRNLQAMGLTLRPDPRDTPGQKGEDEYGEAYDVVNAARLARDSDPVVTEYLRGEVKKALAGKPNIFLTVKHPFKKSGAQWYRGRAKVSPSHRQRLYY